MNKPWQTEKLGAVLTRSDETVEPAAETEYREITVRLWGKGVIERKRLSGASLSGRRFVAHAGQFIASRIDARNGATGLVPPSLEGALVTNDFPLFNLDTERIDPSFLRWLCSTSAFVELCQRASEGTTNRVRLQEERFLALDIPLPPLVEQRRIVTRIEALAAKSEEARVLRRLAMEETDALSVSLLLALLPRQIRTKCLGDLIDPGLTISYGVLVPGPDVQDGVPFVRIQDLALRNPPAMPNRRIAREVDAQYKRTRLHGGEILIGVVGSIGKLGIAPASWAGANIARAVCRIAPNEAVDRDYLALVLSSRTSQDYFRETTRTLAQPTLNVSQLSKVPIPFPPLEEQRRIVVQLNDLQKKTHSLRVLQEATSAQLDALLPSVLSKAFAGEL